MDMIVILALVAGGIALFGAGHINATWLAKAKADVKKIGDVVGQDLRSAQSNAQLAMSGGWGAAMGQVESAAAQFIQHPLLSTEHMLMHAHADKIIAGFKDLWDDSALLAKQAAVDTEKKIRDELRAKVLAQVPPK